MNQNMARILCVDDEPLNLSLLEAMLSPRGYDVVSAVNGPEALEKIQTERIDICLLDVMMPGMNGFEVCRRIKSDELHRNIPVVMITSYADKENRIRGIEAGAEDFISKPFDSTEVLARIKMLLHVKSLNDRVQSAYHNDELTGLCNRRGFLTFSEQQLKIAERTKENIVLLFIDLDHMKWINDTLGHQEGDTALVEIAAILRQTFRKSDIIGRMGGDEFAVLAIDTAHEGRKTVARLRDALDSFNKSETRRYKLSLSVGAAHFYPENPSPLDELIATADNLMYEEKRTKRH